ncbi:hypothetical protein ACVRY7_04420 [Streptococcus ictaluri]|uniref:5-bromo-4-chloroindolyl phosphate hydrolysis protein n=1 Tax=Streptococcus ictaluri 707-05 TaxID=764299 RepID=G5K4R0_9STRE|nr:hypothetical protein [Streptococcus ictaluri]EHI69104.1 hypothetical protein STRIC_1797 [Streptococcus ictaluri 707-05]
MAKQIDLFLQKLPRLPKWLWLLIYLFTLGFLSEIEILNGSLLGLTAIALGIGVFKVNKRQKYLHSQGLAKRIQDLKDTVHLADKQHKLLNDYLLIHDYQHYRQTAEQLLPKLDYIKRESLQLQKQISKDTFHRINQKADDVKVDTVLQLEQLQALEDPSTDHQDMDVMIIQKAPELKDIYLSIRSDHRTILDKIKKADNRAELEAIHDSSMQKFYDILNGYLSIKASPKDYYKAEQPLEGALEAMKQFDLDLDENLRQLNESDLKDFDISLRLMQEKSRQHPSENP